MDRNEAPVELGRIAAGIVVGNLDRTERSAMLKAAVAVNGNPRALERFAAAFVTGLIVELQGGGRTSALDAVFPTLKEK